MLFTEDIGMGIGLGFGISQSVILLILMMYFPEPYAIVYNFHPVNGTFPPISSAEKTSISPLYLVSSLVICIFTFVTYQMKEQQMMDNVMEYTVEMLQQVSLWNHLTWSIFALGHLTVSMTLTSPTTMYCLILVQLLYFYSTGSLCSPVNASSSLQTVWVLMYLSASCIVYEEMSNKHGPRLAIFVIQTASDMLLVMGHKIEQPCNLQRAGNCRLTYSTIQAAILIMLYYISGK